MNTKFGLSNFINENSAIYTIMITAPMILGIAFLGAFIFASHYKEISDTWKNNPKKIKDEFKLLGIGLLFFLFLTVIYVIIYRPFY